MRIYSVKVQSRRIQSQDTNYLPSGSVRKGSWARWTQMAFAVTLRWVCTIGTCHFSRSKTSKYHRIVRPITGLKVPWLETSQGWILMLTRKPERHTRDPFQLLAFPSNGEKAEAQDLHTAIHKLLSADLCRSPMPPTQRLCILVHDINRDLGNNNTCHLRYTYHGFLHCTILHIFSISCVYNYPAHNELRK